MLKKQLTERYTTAQIDDARGGGEDRSDTLRPERMSTAEIEAGADDVQDFDWDNARIGLPAGKATT